MDTFSPKNNFYLYVNQKWMNDNSIPNDLSRYGQFNVLDEQNKERVKDIIMNSDNKNISILYNKGLNEEERNKIDLKKFLDVFDRIKSKEELMNYLFDLEMLYQIKGSLSYYVYSDPDNSDMNILHISPSGLGLYDRDYYFKEQHENIRNEYKKFIYEYGQLFNLELNSESIYNFEKQLAEHHYDKVKRRDPNLSNNKISSEELMSNYKFLYLDKIFFTFNKKPGIVNITNVEFLDFHNKLYNELSLETLIMYHKYRLILCLGSYLGIEIQKRKFDFYGKVLSGTKEMKPLWKRVIEQIEPQLGELIGQSYCNKYFTEKSKNKSYELVEFIKKVLKNRLKTNDWMTSETKERALNKLDKMSIKLGYPDKLRDYTKLYLSEEMNYLDNHLIINRFDQEYLMNELYEKKNKDKWHMNAHTVNAYYSPSSNEIVFPAGILQKPFFDINQSMERNFGGIGMVIGHEMTHGFDDQGRKYNGDGNLEDWWKKEDAEKYLEKTNKIKNHFNSLELLGCKINGELTLGENIADLGGLSISYEAMNNYFESNNLKPNNKEYFENYARIWRCNFRDEELKNRIETDPHSPPEFRVNKILQHFEPFYNEYNITKDDKAYLDTSLRGSVW